MTQDKTILIVGAGIAGQTLASALKKRGINSEIVELKPEFKVIGSGMYVQSNGLRALQDIGVVADIVKSGWSRDDDCSVIADISGQTIALTKHPRIAGESIPGTVPIRRQVLHEILQEKTTILGIPVRMGTTITSIGDKAASKPVKVSLSDGTEGEYDLVVGADGINSTVRSLIFPGVEPQYSGYTNWRVILPQPADIEHITWMYGRETSIGIIPIGDGKVYIAGVTKEPNEDHIAPDELLARFHANFGAYGGAVPGLISQVTDPEQIVYTPISEVYMQPPWYKGRVVLVGDAAHASTPFWAQGASMAIEDVILLARLLESADGYETALAEWMSRRVERCQFVQVGSRLSGDAIHKSADEDSDLTLAPDVLAQSIQRSIDERAARFAEPI